MRIGTENKKQIRWLVSLLTIAALTTGYHIGRLAQRASAPGNAMASAAALSGSGGRQQSGGSIKLDLGLRPLNQEASSEFGGRNIFYLQDTRVVPPKPPSPRAEDQGQQQQPDTQSLSVPSIPFKVYGFVDRSNEPRRVVFRTDDNAQVFVARLGDTVAGHYRVVDISRKSVTVEDMLQNFPGNRCRSSAIERTEDGPALAPLG